MRILLTPKFAATLLLSIITGIAGLITTAATAQAQDIVGGAARTNLSGGSSGPSTSGPKRPRTQYVTNTRTVVVNRNVPVTPNKGSLVVSAEPRATIVVEPVRGGTGDEGEVPADRRTATFNDLLPGRYRVAAALEGYEEASSEVTVVKGKASDVTLNLVPITYNVQINANISTGEIRYAPVIARGTDPSTGQTLYDKIPGSDTRIVNIVGSRATLNGLRPGMYGLDVRADERAGLVGYQFLTAVINLPGKTNIDVNLERLVSTKMFSWTSIADWDVPGNWGLAARNLAVKGRGVALPNNDDYRHYADFQLISDVKMVNGVAASFVARAQNANDYYLIQLTGPSADEPYVLRGFVVRGGNPQRLTTIPIDAFTQTLRANQFFTVTMKMTDNSIRVSITDSQTGDVLPLGIITDPARNFRTGAVGIGARDNEQNEIGRFMVCANECKEG
ncbi:MAG TPA: hypothetical protein VF553_14010 [Pyrinomonadaceae bacterium]|jgi:hypothetical protein